MICSNGLELTFPGLEGDWHSWQNCTGGYTAVKIKMTEKLTQLVGIYYIATLFILGNFTTKKAIYLNC
jgi:hypothetical protein